jgi:hypothetical protein
MFVCGLNVVLLFYIYLFAIKQSGKRQDAWFRTFLIWLLLEVFIISTLVVIIMNVIVPSLVMRDLQNVKKRLMQAIKQYNRSCRGGETYKPEPIFNVADYLFVSTRLSKLYPYLIESKIIQKFSTPWPHHSYQRTKDLSKSYSKRFSTIIRSATMILVFLLKGLLQLPPGAQDMLGSMLSALIAGNILQALVGLYQRSVILLVFVLVGAIFCIGSIVRFFYGFVSQKIGLSSETAMQTEIGKQSRRTNINLVREATVEPESDVVDPTSDSNGLKTRRASVAAGVKVLKQLQGVHKVAPRSDSLHDERKVSAPVIDDYPDKKVKTDIIKGSPEQQVAFLGTINAITSIHSKRDAAIRDAAKSSLRSAVRPASPGRSSPRPRSPVRPASPVRPLSPSRRTAPMAVSNGNAVKGDVSKHPVVDLKCDSDIIAPSAVSPSPKSPESAVSQSVNNEFLRFLQIEISSDSDDCSEDDVAESVEQNEDEACIDSEHFSSSGESDDVDYDFDYSDID